MEPIDRYIHALRAAARLYSLFADRGLQAEWSDDWLFVAAEARLTSADVLSGLVLDRSSPPPVAIDDLGGLYGNLEAAIRDTELALLRLGEEVYVSDLPDAAKRIVEARLADSSEVLSRLGVGPAEVVDSFALDNGSEPGAEIDGEVDAFGVWFATNRKPVDVERPQLGLSNERSDFVRYGRCVVRVPRSHRIGSLGDGLLCRVFGGDGRLSLESIHPLTREDFLVGMADDAAATDGLSRALVFVHGYNVSFEAAALRTAQIGFDLGVGGATAFFSWPSQGRFYGYFADGDAIAASAPALTEFLVDIATLPGIHEVNVVAHSMGNRGLLSAVCRIAADAERLSGRRFGQFVLAAADVDAQTFRNDARTYSALAMRTTLYVSPRDAALKVSSRISRFPRAGLHPPVTIVDGIDTLDVGEIDLERLGHGYVGNHRGVIADIHELITRGTPPKERFGVEERRDDDGATYWAFRG